MRCAVCWFRSDPPKTRDRLSNARLPQARQYGVLLLLMSSHSAQKVAACKGTKFRSRYFDASALLLPNNISSPLHQGERHGKQAAAKGESDRRGSSLCKNRFVARETDCRGNRRSHLRPSRHSPLLSYSGGSH